MSEYDLMVTFNKSKSFLILGLNIQAAAHKGRLVANLARDLSTSCLTRSLPSTELRYFPLIDSELKNTMSPEPDF